MTTADFIQECETIEKALSQSGIAPASARYLMRDYLNPIIHQAIKDCDFQSEFDLTPEQVELFRQYCSSIYIDFSFSS